VPPVNEDEGPRGAATELLINAVLPHARRG